MLNLFKKKNKGKRGELRSMLEGYELPSFPAMVMNVLGMLRDPQSSLEDIAVQIEMDPGMHVRVLKVVNSAAFGLSKKVINIPHAVTLLGRSRLESLILSVAIKDSVPSDSLGSFDVNQFWLSSARRATMARSVAGALHPASQSESFTTGLLQDIAVLVLFEVKKEKYEEVYKEWQDNVATQLHLLEKEAFGFDHAVLSGLMAEEWGLPDCIEKMISAHHDPEKYEKMDPAVKLVAHIRDSMVLDGSDTFIEECKAEFNLSNEVMIGMKEKAFEDAEQFCKML